MSVLQVYLSWANSVLSEVNDSVENVSGVQEGKALCQIIDILAPDAGLLAKIQASGVTTQRAYIQMALEHMKVHGVKLTFSAQDIIDGDIKSLLDVMWLLILNYCIHFIGEHSTQRGVGTGKKALLEWCQGELEVVFDPKNTLAYSLCTGNGLLKLLQQFAGRHIEETENKVGYVASLLHEMEERYGIRQSIMSPTDITDGTVDDHTLMIYLSLLRRRVCNTARRREMFSVQGKEAALEKERLRSVSEEAPNRRRHSELVTLTQQLQEQQQKHPQRSTRSVSMDSRMATPPVRASEQSRSQESVESDWLSSDTNSLISGRGRSPGERSNFLLSETEQVLRQTISDKVKEHLPAPDRDENKDTDASQAHSGRDTESVSEFSSGALDEGYITNRKETPRTGIGAPKEKGKGREDTVSKKPVDKESSGGGGTKRAGGSEPLVVGGERSTKVRIKRPKDYYLQWEETIDRLSQGPPAPPDVSDMSPRSPRQILRGIEEAHTPRSRSASSESDVYGGQYAPVWKRKEYLERRSGSVSSNGRYEELAYSPRSNSLPLSISLTSTDREGDRRGSPSPGPRDKGKGKSTQVRQTDSSGKSKRESHRSGQDHPKAELNGSSEETLRNGINGRQEISWPAVEGSSNFMERLEELKRSGRAQRVILPDLGPEAPVLMIPGQGEEVLLLFDALRQARLEVNLNMAKANGSSAGTPEHSDGTRSPGRSSPSPDTDSTEVKRPAKAGREGTSMAHASTAQDDPAGPTGRLQRPTVHRHHFPKSTDVRLASLRFSRDGHRAKSLTERSAVPVIVNTTSDSSRYHSLSPPRKQSPHEAADQSDYTPRSQSVRSRMTVREVGTDRTGVMLSSPGRRTLSSGRGSARSVHTDFTSSPVTFSESASASRFRRPTSQSHFKSPSPLKLTSSRSSPERPPPLELPADLASPRPKTGGLGRVPRREAWERQRQKQDSSGRESTAQAKFIEVLCKEIEELKQKIEVMEESQAESSPERASPARGGQSTPTGQTGTFYTSRSEIQETDNKMVLAPRGQSPSVMIHRARQSPRPWESQQSSFSPSHSSQRVHSARSSASPRRQYPCASPTADRARGRQSPSPDRSRPDNLSPSRRTGGDASPSTQPSRSPGESRPVTSPASSADLNTSGGPDGAGRGINLGYKSPIRSVTQEIWGKDLTSVEGLDPNRKDNYKRLISQSSLSEEDVIELKQSLASAVVENDILQAKLNNARMEIQGKLSKTNEVLDDCRRHLAKSQAENMELRTALEREKDRAETSEGRVRDLQQIVQQVRADNEELEQELDHTLSILDRSKPGIDALKKQNAQLHVRASVMQNENCSLKKDMDDLRKSHFKSVNTIRELRHLLDEVREERNDLQQRLGALERLRNESKVKSIILHYSQEKGAKDETEHEYTSSGVSSLSERPWSSSHLPRPSEEVTPRSLPGKGTTGTISGTTPRPSSPGQGLNYSYDDLSATVPSSYREIYPHRKLRYQGLSVERYPEEEDSPVPFIDYPDLQHYPTKLERLELNEDYGDEEEYRKPSPREPSPILKPTPYRPYLQDNKSSYTPLPDRFFDPSPEPQTRGRGRSPVRTSREFRESRSTSCSPARGLSNDLNRSFDVAMFEHKKRRSASSSPGRYQDDRKGILKKGSSLGRARDRSWSPRYGIRSHSPPTRLSPEDKKAQGRKLLFTRTEAGQIARDLQREFDKEDLILDGLRNKHSTKSWFELQLEEADCSSEAPLPEIVGEEHLLLSEEQRNYANELIKKYTGLKL